MVAGVRPAASASLNGAGVWAWRAAAPPLLLLIVRSRKGWVGIAVGGSGGGTATARKPAA